MELADDARVALSSAQQRLVGIDAGRAELAYVGNKSRPLVWTECELRVQISRRLEAIRDYKLAEADKKRSTTEVSPVTKRQRSAASLN